MSTDNISAFLDKTHTDEALATKVRGIDAESDAAAAEALSRLATEAGLPFTAEEFLASRSDALADADLEQVAGGTSINHILQGLGAKARPVIADLL